MHEADGRVDKYQIHGHEREPDEKQQLLSIWDGDRTFIQVPVAISGGTMHFENLSALWKGTPRVYGGVLTKGH